MSFVEYHKKTNRIFSEFECHCHSVYEIYYFISGDAEILIEGKKYKLVPHSLILLAPGVLHGIQVNSSEDYVRNVLYIAKKDVIPERLHILTDIVPDIKKEPSKAFIYEHAEAFHMDQFYYNIYQLDNQPKEFQEMFEPIFNEAFLAQLYILCRALKPSNVEIRTDKKITEIVNYINLHLTELLSLEQISSKFFISKNYLNKLFKQYLGTTVIEYIRYKRVIIARQYMIQDGESAMNAALKVGFSDYSSFYRTYRKYIKTSPRNDL